MSSLKELRFERLSRPLVFVWTAFSTISTALSSMTTFITVQSLCFTDTSESNLQHIPKTFIGVMGLSPGPTRLINTDIIWTSEHSKFHL